MSTALVRTSVNFHGDPLEAIQQDGVTYAPVKPICDILGLDWSAQYRRIEHDEVLSEGMVIMAIPSAGGPQEARRSLPALPLLSSLSCARMLRSCSDSGINASPLVIDAVRTSLHSLRAATTYAVSLMPS